MTAPPAAMPRTVLALYHPAGNEIRYHLLHAVAEFPMNHLGMVVRYHNVLEPLPDPDTLPGLRAVVTWFRGARLDDPAAFLAWAGGLQARGVRFVVLGDLLFAGSPDDPAIRAPLAGFLAGLGLRYGDRWISASYGVTFPVRDARMMDYERALGGMLQEYPVVRPTDPTDPAVRSWLVARYDDDPDLDSHLVVTGPAGGFAAAGYEVFTEDSGYNPASEDLDPDGLRAWLLDPFLFFGQALGLDGLPRPDITTLTGRRMYFSHIDGDGWNSKAELPGYEERGAIASEVVMREAIEPFPDLPVTVAPIAAELDPDWRAVPQSQDMARALFALPQVETASHTYTHPFHWDFFADYTPEKEAPFVAALEASGQLNTYGSAALDQEILDIGEADLSKKYSRPRAFLDQPFDLDREMGGAAAFIDRFAPADKPVRLVQWSGDTKPYPEALTAAREAGLLNINGGDTRFDGAFPSVAWVSPNGRLVGPPDQEERQIYTAASNENTYTDLWRGRFFGFRFLTETLDRCESPMRLKPINVYYHMYSGSKVASLNALLHNLYYARAHPVCPVTTTHFVTIVDGFYDTLLIPLGPDRWRVSGRGALQTIRFDAATHRAVDMVASEGVLGQRHYQGSLYVALDPAVAAPEIALMDWPTPDRAPPGTPRPYLIESRWPLRALRRDGDGDGLTVQAQGFGDGAMAWQVPPEAEARVTARDAGGAAVARLSARADRTGRLAYALPPVGLDAVEVHLALARPS
ncbi:polysaccharide deacetylase family protein [Roseospira goensis]|uniref:Uncharacterized protein n=1 Tax=Roseospira goensis TaxID=391922 RepID=A0A7W6RZL2_9PROT|nr:hypothetical protein [Roseospira goensis]MBB4285986.1 hypothetical protein [Roseospira goensis]